MEKSRLLIPMFAALVMTGCSSDDAIIPDGGIDNGVDGEPQYLTVNLVTNTSSQARATGDPNNAEYEEGLTDENAVKKVRFYFFDEFDEPASVKKVGDNYYNYMDWTEISEADKDMPNVEKILSATLVIQSPDDLTPDKIVAIINPVEDPDATTSLVTLADVAGNYQTKTANGEFVMSNSTYEKNNAQQMAVSIDGKIFNTAGEALNNPINIHVERTVAKVRLKSSLTPIENQTNIFKTSTADNTQMFGDKEIFVKFLGWNTTAVADKSRLVKKINPNWEPDLLGGGEPWNWSDYSRSFWAINADGVNYQYGAFNNNENADNLFQAQANTKFDKSQWVYINENASDDNNGAKPATTSKVIIAAQLVDENGNSLEFAEYGSTRTTVSGLLTLFANNCGLYKKNETEGGISFSKIAESDLIIKTATAVSETGSVDKGRYKVYVQLTPEAENTTWYPSNINGSQALTTAQANKALLDLGAAKVWTEGYTYYYFDIKHLGTMTGVVRNHIYDANITSLKGLGTPVYDPDEIIYPEKPTDDEDTFIAAQISILSWRVVNNDVSLEW